MLDKRHETDLFFKQEVTREAGVKIMKENPTVMCNGKKYYLKTRRIPNGYLIFKILKSINLD